MIPTELQEHFIVSPLCCVSFSETVALNENLQPKHFLAREIFFCFLTTHSRQNSVSHENKTPGIFLVETFWGV